MIKFCNVYLCTSKRKRKMTCSLQWGVIFLSDWDGCDFHVARRRKCLPSRFSPPSPSPTPLTSWTCLWTPMNRPTVSVTKSPTERWSAVIIRMWVKITVLFGSYRSFCSIWVQIWNNWMLPQRINFFVQEILNLRNSPAEFLKSPELETKVSFSDHLFNYKNPTPIFEVLWCFFSAP